MDSAGRPTTHLAATSQPIKAGATYFALVFAAGFVLGTIRTLFVLPAIGETAAVAVELPLILAISWLACGFVLGKIPVAATASARLAMGVVALGLLLLAEIGVSTLLAGRSVSEHLSLYKTAPSLLGLAGQIAFATFPLIRR